MGLDTVELVMAFEDEFGIRISNEDAGKITTPGEVADYVMTLVRTKADEACPSQKGFYRIRSALVTSFGIPRRDIDPNSLLHEIVKGDIKQQWSKLQNALGAESFPQLRRTRMFFNLVVIGLPAIIVAPMLKTGAPVSWVVLAYALLSLSAHLLTARMGTIIPAKCQTVSALIPYVGCASSLLWTRKAVLARVIQLTSVQLGIPVDKIRPDSHFVHDLGAD